MVRGLLTLTLTVMCGASRANLLSPLAELSCAGKRGVAKVTLNRSALTHSILVASKRCAFQIVEVQRTKRGGSQKVTVFYSLESCEGVRANEKNFRNFGLLRKGFMVFDLNGAQATAEAHLFENSQAVQCESPRLSAKAVAGLKESP